jgi:hypothetical protein
MGNGSVSVVQSTTGDQRQYVDNKKSVYLDNVRARMNSAKRSIVNLQNVLMNLKSTQLLIQQRMNRSIKMEEVARHYSFDKYQNNDYLQGISPVTNYGGDPDARINFTRNQLLKGQEYYITDLNRVGTKIAQITQQLKAQQEILKQCQSQLVAMGKDSQIYITKDGISKRQYTEVYMLYQIHQKYKYANENYVGTTAFSSDPLYFKMATKMRDQFRFYAERNPFVQSGDLVLDLNNPGSDFNAHSLGLFLDRLREVMGNSAFTKYDADTKKYTEQMLTNVMHPFISQNLQRSVENIRVPDATSALRYSVDTPSRAVNKMIRAVNVASTLTWDSSTYIGAALSNFSSQISGLYNMPMCSPIWDSTSASIRQQSDSTTAQIEAQSATVFSKEFAATKSEVPIDDVTVVIENMFKEVQGAVRSTSDKGTPAKGLIRIAGISYTAFVLYQVRIINNSARLLDYMYDMLIKGNLTQTQYNYFIDRLVMVITESSPNFIITGDFTNYSDFFTNTDF